MAEDWACISAIHVALGEEHERVVVQVSTKGAREAVEKAGGKVEE